MCSLKPPRHISTPPNPDLLLGAARPLPPSADIGPGGQSVGQAAQFCLGRLALQVFRIKPFGEKPESAGLAPAGGPPAL